MGRAKKSTLRGAFWRAQLKRIQHCFVCGGRLSMKYVRAEKMRRRVCEKCGEITYLNPKVVAGLIPVDSKGRIALLKRAIDPAKGKWSYPAGFVEWGESVAMAAARETLEEICAKVDVKHLLGVYAYPDAGVVTTVYVGRLRAGEKPSPGDESQEVDLFYPDEIPWKKLAFRSTVEALNDFLNQKRRK